MEAAAAAALEAGAVRARRLASGATVLARDVPGAPHVLLRLVVRAGSLDEAEHEVGAAHFVEHCGFRGTKSYANGSLQRFLESLGGQFGADLNAKTGPCDTIWMLNCPLSGDAASNLERLEACLGVLGEWASGIRFSREDVEHERRVILEELRGKRGPEQRVKQAFWERFLPALARRVPIGTKNSIEALSADTLRAFYERMYVPSAMAVVAVGDLECIGHAAGLCASLERLGSFSFTGRNVSAPPRRPLALPLRRPVCAVIHEDGIDSASVSLELYSPLLALAGPQFVRREVIKRVFASLLEARVSELTARPHSQHHAGNGHDDGSEDEHDAGQPSAAEQDEGVEEENKADTLVPGRPRAAPWLSAGVSCRLALNDPALECTSLAATVLRDGQGFAPEAVFRRMSSGSSRSRHSSSSSGGGGGGGSGIGISDSGTSSSINSNSGSGAPPSSNNNDIVPGATEEQRESDVHSVRRCVRALLREAARLVSYPPTQAETDYAKHKWRHLFQRRLSVEERIIEESVKAGREAEERDEERCRRHRRGKDDNGNGRDELEKSGPPQLPADLADTLELEAEELIEHFCLRERTPLLSRAAESRLALALLEPASDPTSIRADEVWEYARQVLEPLCELRESADYNAAVVIQGQRCGGLDDASLEALVVGSLYDLRDELALGDVRAWAFQPPLESPLDIARALLPVHLADVCAAGAERGWRGCVMERTGARAILLRNGVRVCVVDTGNFSAAGCLSLQAFALGGCSELSAQEVAAFSLLGEALQSSGLGLLGELDLSRLESKQGASVRLQQHWFHRGLGGSCRAGRLELLLQMVAARLLGAEAVARPCGRRAGGVDQAALKRHLAAARAALDGAASSDSADLRFAEEVRKTLIGNDEAVFQPHTKELLEAVTPSLVAELYTEAFVRDPTEFIFVLCGDFKGALGAGPDLGTPAPDHLQHRDRQRGEETFEGRSAVGGEGGGGGSGGGGGGDDDDDSRDERVWRRVGDLLQRYLGGAALLPGARGSAASRRWPALPRDMKLAFPQVERVHVFSAPMQQQQQQQQQTDEAAKAEVLLAHHIRSGWDPHAELDTELSLKLACAVAQTSLLETLRVQRSLIYSVRVEHSRNSLARFGLVFTSLTCDAGAAGEVTKLALDEFSSLARRGMSSAGPRDGASAGAAASFVAVARQMTEWHKAARRNNSYHLFWVLDAWKRRAAADLAAADQLKQGKQDSFAEFRTAAAWVDANVASCTEEEAFCARVNAGLDRLDQTFASLFVDRVGLVMLPAAAGKL